MSLKNEISNIRMMDKLKTEKKKKGEGDEENTF